MKKRLLPITQFCLLLGFLILLATSTTLSAATVTNPGNSGPGTLRALLNAGEEDIYFASNIHTIQLLSPIIIKYNTQFRVPENRRITIDGQGKTAHFWINKTTDYATYVQFDNMDFINGMAYNNDGGSIYSRSSTLVLNNCTFINCHADLKQTGFAVPFDGGAISFWEGSSSDYDLEVYDCYFKGNSSRGDGGAICINAWGGKTTIQRSTFEENRANQGNYTRGGSAVYMRYTSDAKIEACTFTKNGDSPIQPNINNAVIYAGYNNSKLKVTNCTFFENRGDKMICGQGPVYHLGFITVQNSILGKNQIGGPNWFDQGVFLEGTNFFDVASVGQVSKIQRENHFSSDPKIVPYLIPGPKVAPAHPVEVGSPAVYSGIPGPVTRDQFNNSLGNPPMTGSLNRYGYVVTNTYDYGADVITPVEGSLRRVIELAPANAIIFIDVPEGRMITLARELVINKPLTIVGKGLDAIRLDGTHYKRLVTVSANVTFKNMSFTRGYSASGTGGAIRQEGGNFRAENCRFSNNWSSGYYSGGVLYATGNAGTTSFKNCIFDSNSAQNGGVVQTYTGTLNFENCSFWKNYAYNGGVLHLDDANGSAVFRNCSFGENGDSRVESTTYYGHGAGSAIYTKGKVTLQHCSVIGNKSNGNNNSGAISAIGGSAVVKIISSIVALNNVESGTAFDISGIGITVLGSVIGGDPLVENAILDHDNGSYVFKILEGSPAIDLGIDSIYIRNDQVGNPRRILGCNMKSDAGAFELQGCYNAAEYCFRAPINQMEYIDSVIVNGQKVVTGNNNGLFRVSDPILQIPTNSPFDVSLTVSHLNSVYLHGWRIVIDFNQNGSFDDETPILDTFGDSLKASPDIFNATLNLSGQNTLPEKPVMMQIQTDDWRVKRDQGVFNAAGYPGNILDCGGTMYGETEYYIVQLVPGGSKMDPTPAPVSTYTGSLTQDRPGKAGSEAKLSISPIPARDFLNIVLEHGNSPMQKIQLYDLQGHLVLEKTANDTKVRIETGQFPAGMYLLNVTTDTGVFAKRVIIQK